MRLKLSVKISLLVVAAALAASLAIAAVAYSEASQELRLAAESKLLALLQARTMAVRDYLHSIQRDLRLQATSPMVVEGLSRFITAGAALGPETDALLRDVYIAKN